jgi:hypothetical protein
LSQLEYQNKKNSLFLSIDLEDFTYDTYRNLGYEPLVNFEALEKSYEVINDFSKNFLDSKKITFFTTGTVALTHPKLLKRIVEEGHEIACHYHFHDMMTYQSIEEIESNLILAKKAISDACGVEPRGFRAPAFSIPNERIEIYQLLSKHFSYDSSYILNTENQSVDVLNSQEPFAKKDFIELPIITYKWLNRFNIKSGGTFFRLFSLNLIKKVLKQSSKEGQIPMIYLHPYDFLCELEFKVPLSTFLKKHSLIFGTYKYLRQFQWLKLNNKSTLKKLQKISTEYHHIGPIGHNL